MGAFQDTALLHELSDGVLILDPSGRPRYANPALRGWLELGVDAPLPADLAGRFAPAAAWEALRAGPQRVELTLCEHRLRATSIHDDGGILLLLQPAGGTLAELERQAAEERRRMAALMRITSELATSMLDLERVLHRALELVGEAVGATQGSIYLLDPPGKALIQRAALGREEPLPPDGEPIPYARGIGLLGAVFAQRRPVLVGDVEHDERWEPLPQRPEGCRSLLAAPLSSSEGVVGVLLLYSARPEAFDEAQLQLVQAATLQIGAAMGNAELYKYIREQADQLGSLMRGEQEEAAKSAAILESVADGVMVVDARGKIILFNAAAERLFELDRRQIMDQAISKFTSLWGQAGAEWEKTIQRWTQTPEAAGERQFLEARLEFGDKVASVHLAPVLSARGGLSEFLGTVSVFRDITRDVELDRMQREWVSTVSHELRTPMTSIKGYADLLMLGAAGPTTEMQMRFLDIIKNNADRLSLLVNDLLDISRIETGRMKLNFGSIDVYELVNTVVANLLGRREQEGKEIGIQAGLPAGLPAVRGDIDRVTQILTNLLDNAFNYTPAGGSISVSAHQIGRDDADRPARVQFRVADTGIGISAEDLPKILDRFYRSDDPFVQQVSGTGLGLAIVHHLVEMHGGRLTVESEGAGKGSTFSFTLPIADTHTQADE